MRGKRAWRRGWESQGGGGLSQRGGSGYVYEMTEPDLSDAAAQAKAALARLRAALGELPDAEALEPSLREARDRLVAEVRRRPISALAIAFGAGVALALLTRG